MPAPDELLPLRPAQVLLAPGCTPDAAPAPAWRAEPWAALAAKRAKCVASLAAMEAGMAGAL
jgi:hypothetical protein